VKLLRGRWGGTKMVESRHSGCANQCSRGRKMADAVLLLLLLCCLPFLSSVSQTNHFPPFCSHLPLPLFFFFFLSPSCSFIPLSFSFGFTSFSLQKKTDGLSLSVSLTFSFKKILLALLFCRPFFFCFPQAYPP